MKAKPSAKGSEAVRGRPPSASLVGSGAPPDEVLAARRRPTKNPTRAPQALAKAKAREPVTSSLPPPSDALRIDRHSGVDDSPWFGAALTLYEAAIDSVVAGRPLDSLAPWEAARVRVAAGGGAIAANFAGDSAAGARLTAVAGEP